MSFVFVSHAAPDKRTRVKPLVWALALEGANLWLDRPGAGDDAFEFEVDFIRRHRIKGLAHGLNWDDGVRQALRDSAAVLVCLSNQAVAPERTVLGQEMFAAQWAGKAVTCIVDDLDITAVPADRGLLSLGRSQAIRVDVAGLQAALAWLTALPGRVPSALPEEHRAAWQVVLQLREDLQVAAQRAWLRPTPGGQLPVDAHGLAAAAVALRKRLALLPVAPAMLERLYRRALPDNRRARADGVLDDWLSDLADARPRRAGLPSPVIEFAERLGQERPETALTFWVDAQTVHDLPARTALRDMLRAEAQQAATLQATLFVDVDPETERHVRWWVHSTDPVCCLAEQFVPLPAGADAHALDSALAGALAQALATTEAAIGHRCRVNVALLLSPALLARPVEALPIALADDGLGPQQVPLLSRYAVTLHWRTRALAGGLRRPSPALNAWTHALSALTPRLRSGAGARLAWHEPGQAGAAPTLAAASARLLDPAEAAICLGLAPPSQATAAAIAPVGASLGSSAGATAETALQAAIADCLRAGLPCFVWFRPPLPDPLPPWRGPVADLFACHTANEAPRRVAEQRMASAACDLLTTLAIVWDTPELLPVADPLISPSSSPGGSGT